MNLFKLIYCVDLKDDKGKFAGEEIKSSYNGPIVALENLLFPGLYVFFPISRKNMNLINQATEGKSLESKELSIYKTMIDSWKGSANYLSGIIMDLVCDFPDTEPKIVVNLTLSDDNGDITGLIPVSFVDSMIISVILKHDFVLTSKLLSHIMPESPFDNGTSGRSTKDIVRGILDGKVKDNKPDNKDKKNKNN